MPRLEQRLEQKQILAPQQILQASLLQLPMANLEQKIIEELEINPVLEAVEREPEEPEKSEKDDSGEAAEEDQIDWESISNDTDYYKASSTYDSSKENVDMPVPDRQDFLEGLIKQLDLYDLPEWERQVAEEIIWNLDEHGYLGIDITLIADRFDTTVARIEKILYLVQHLEPAGIAARSLQECILIQLEDQPDSLAYKIIAGHFDDFANRRFKAIMDDLDCSNEELSAAAEQIARLNPRPGDGQHTEANHAVIPDLTIREQEGHWIITTNDNWLPELRVNSSYQMMLNEKHKPEVLQFVKQKIDSANWFIQAIQQRRRTLTAVMQSIIDKQPEFFNDDNRRLRPMKLQDIADEIMMDISTISRSTRGKYVDTPFGIFELKSFFTEGISLQDGREVSNKIIKDALKEIIEGEDTRQPLNDEQIVQMLKDSGYPVARRTVAKYREQLKLPVARLRKKL
ncbi:MAG: RNA polymerase factor sigma-54 [Candidatus Neomarinimicrobiota bacterium]